MIDPRLAHQHAVAVAWLHVAAGCFLIAAAPLLYLLTDDTSLYNAIRLAAGGCALQIFGTWTHARLRRIRPAPEEISPNP